MEMEGKLDGISSSFIFLLSTEIILDAAMKLA